MKTSALPRVCHLPRAHALHTQQLLLVFAAVLLLAIAPAIQAVTPAPDGGYPGGNTAEGTDALFSVTTGANNVAIGFEALHANTTGSGNTASGGGSLHSNTGGNLNTGTGLNALFLNTTGSRNTACGAEALANNTIGNQNTSVGQEALNKNTSGLGNNAIGALALHNNTSGEGNIANGVGAMYYNLIGNYNTAVGTEALQSGKNANNNTAIGAYALTSSMGSGNVAAGYEALAGNGAGERNTATGLGALSSNTSGSLNIALGYQAGSSLTTGSNNIDIGAVGAAGEANTIRIGKANTQKATFIQGIYNSSVSNGLTVTVNSAGRLGVNAISSERFKEDIQPMAGTSEALLSLHPVTYRYKTEVDAAGDQQFGLVAEEVGKVNPALVVRNAEGQIDGVRYEAVNAMLLNEFLKEHRKVEQLQEQVDALEAGLKKVSARVELQAAYPQVTASDR